MEGDSNDQFSLCWDNFLTNMSSGLNSLLQSEDLVDVTLAAEGRYLKAHKMILSVCSPYFKELFQVNPCKHPIVFLKDVSYNILKNLLEFMYMGEVKVSHNDLPNFIKTAEALKIKGLTGDQQNQSEVSHEPEAPPTAPTPSPIKTGALNESVTLTRKSVREKTPPPRKKMLGPASKRFKSDTEYVKSQQPEQKIIENSPFEMQTALVNDSVTTKHSTPLAPTLVALKMEPEEDLSNHDDTTYEEPMMDELGLDGTTDYLDTADDSKAGTSTDVVNADIPGENQERLRYIRGPRGSILINIGSYLFKKYNYTSSNRKTYWRCLNYHADRCPSSCITSEDGKVAYVGFHHHGPHKDQLQKLHVIYETAFTVNTPFN